MVSSCRKKGSKKGREDFRENTDGTRKEREKKSSFSARYDRLSNFVITSHSSSKHAEKDDKK